MSKREDGKNRREMTKTKKTSVPQFINPKQVVSVYSGRPGCMCGCRGKHTTAERHREKYTEERPKSAESTDFSDRTVDRIVANMNKRIHELMSGERENYVIEHGEYHGQRAVEFGVSPEGVFLQDNETNRRWYAYFGC
jgi:hypothetical protein